MSGYLAHVLARSRGEGAVLRPRSRSRFEPAADLEFPAPGGVPFEAALPRDPGSTGPAPSLPLHESEPGAGADPAPGADRPGPPPPTTRPAPGTATGRSGPAPAAPAQAAASVLRPAPIGASEPAAAIPEPALARRAGSQEDPAPVIPLPEPGPVEPARRGRRTLRPVRADPPELPDQPQPPEPAGPSMPLDPAGPREPSAPRRLSRPPADATSERPEVPERIWPPEPLSSPAQSGLGRPPDPGTPSGPGNSHPDPSRVPEPASRPRRPGAAWPLAQVESVREVAVRPSAATASQRVVREPAASSALPPQPGTLPARLPPGLAAEGRGVGPLTTEPIAPEPIPPVINVTIGRVEVRSDPPAPPPELPDPGPQPLSLTDYLQGRGRGDR